MPSFRTGAVLALLCLSGHQLFAAATAEYDDEALSTEVDLASFSSSESLDEEFVLVNDSSVGLRGENNRDLKTLDGKCKIDWIDFSTDENGKPLKGGMYVKDNWKKKYGFTILAEGAGAESKARLLDSSRPGVAKQLGAPNSSCRPNKGPGRGWGGKPGKKGENCEKLGNVLILQDENTIKPKDNPKGGKITFLFDKPTSIMTIGLLDINSSKNKLHVFYNGRRSGATGKVPRLGNNSHQVLPLHQGNVVELEVILQGNGAVTGIGFCSDPDVSTPPVDDPVKPTPDDDSDDLGMRFNKIDIFPNMPPRGRSPLPMTAEDYPLSKAADDWLSQAKAISVTRQEDCAVCDIRTEELIRAIGGMPSHPSKDLKSPFWDQMLEVIQVQVLREGDAKPGSIMPLADIWKDYDIHDVAKAVHDEFPGIHHVELLTSFIESGQLNFDREMLPATSKLDFVRGPVALCDLNAWAIGTVSPHNFAIKWFVGRARPEEVAMAVKSGDIPAKYVPLKVRNAIKKLPFKKATEFTAYPEGSPRHPSWPAMHSAASVGSFWMDVVLDLTDEQRCQAKLVDYGVAYARTVAGVHYPDDNTAGLNLGQEILARKLPEFLAERFGADPEKVKAKIKKVEFDWEDFLDSDCAKKAMASA